MKYDYLVVGSGLYGASFAHEAKAKGKSVLVVDKRPNIAGNVYTEKQEGNNVHMYGAHIFHTNDKRVWNYITQFAEFNRFTNSPVANYKGELYSMPFNMYTFNKMWGVVTPAEAKAKIDERLLSAYGRIRSNVRNGLAVVTVKRDACGGCFNRIPPQRQVEIRQGKKLIVCEYCGRILVADPEEGLE